MAGDVLFRSFDASQVSMESDGRTVITRVVPYGTFAEIWTPEEGGKRYTESFDYGACRRAVQAPHHVRFQVDHTQAEMVGMGQEFEEREDGLYGSFRLLETRAALARELINEFGFNALSVGFVVMPGGSSQRRGVIHRTAVHLDHVAMVMSGTEAYSGSRILAMRDRGGLVDGRSAAELPPATPELDALSDSLQADRAVYEARLARMQAVLGNG